MNLRSLFAQTCLSSSEVMTDKTTAYSPAGTSPLPPPPSLSDGPDRSLFLDFDGTLVDIAPQPDAIRLKPGLVSLIRRLADTLGGRLAIVSGRSLADLDRYLDLEGIAMAGSHGGEIREADSREASSRSEGLPTQVQEAMENAAERLGGLLLERKTYGLALHYRDRPEMEQAALQQARAIADAHALKLKRGKMVVELLPPGFDKGNAVARLMERPPFRGSRPLFVGDDVTDEDGFGAVLDYEGGGILVGTERVTKALWRLKDVAAVHAWMAEALAEDTPGDPA